MCPSVVDLRLHAALVRALLEELEHVAPAVGGSDGEVVAAQLIEELTRLGQRILECAATMTPTPETAGGSDADPHGHRLVRRTPASSSRFEAASPVPGTE